MRSAANRSIQAKDGLTLVILGAGASRGSSTDPQPPIMKDFISHGHELVGSRYDDLWKFCDSLGHGFPQLLSGQPNLEELYIELDAVTTGLWYEDEFDYLSSLGIGMAVVGPSAFLRSFIVEVLAPSCAAAVQRPCRQHCDLFAQLRPNDAVLSFNYDLIADSALRETQPWFEDDGYGFAANVVHSSEKRSKGNQRGCHSEIFLLKPHGSINWREIQHFSHGQITTGELAQRKRSLRATVLGLPDPTNTIRSVEVLSLDLDPLEDRLLAPDLYRFVEEAKLTMQDPRALLSIHGSNRSDRDPFIVAPGHYKFRDDRLPSQVGIIWARTRSALEAASRIVCVGYSFPPTDSEFCNLFRFALKNGGRSPRIEVVNPDSRVPSAVKTLAPSAEVLHVAETLDSYRGLYT